MKFLILLASLVVVAATAKLSPDEEAAEFLKYLKNFKIRIARSDNMEERQKLFIESYYTVEAHNSNASSSYKLGINRFSHLNDEELSMKTGYSAESGDAVNADPTPVGFDIGPTPSPDFWDWRQKSAVNYPEDQGLCSSSWVFAAVGAIEGQMRLKKRSYEKLSEQEIIDCTRYQKGCTSGSDGAVYEHSRSYGLTTQSRNPYISSIIGRVCDLRRTPVPYSNIYSWESVQRDERLILDTLYNKGPMFTVLHVSRDFYSYRSGVYTDTRSQCSHTSPNHAVLLIGYGTDNGVDYWLLKNSWGYNWGEQGYFRIRRGINLCGIETYASYPNLA